MARENLGLIVQDWPVLKRRAMLVTLRLKLNQHGPVANCLGATQGRPIIEVSSRDAYWGAVPERSCLQGTNMLGRMWMSLRELHARDVSALQGWAHLQQRDLWPAAYL